LAGIQSHQVKSSDIPLALGIDSLKAAELKYQLDEGLEIDFPITTLLNQLSIAAIVESALQIHRLVDTKAVMATAGFISQEKLPLSVSQQAIWTVNQLFPNSPIYNLPIALQINSPVDVDNLQAAFSKLLKQHEQLRRVCQLDEMMQPVQYLLLNPATDFLHIVCANEAERTHYINAATRTIFNLQQGPLLQARLFSLADNDHVLFILAHHIAVDFRSLIVLLNQLKQHYLNDTSNVSHSKANYADYLVWQRDYLNSQHARQDFEYWKQQLSGELPKLELALDRVRPSELSCHGGLETVTLNTDTAQALKAFAKREQTTLYTLLLTIFKIMLHRYTGQTDLIVGSPTLGRPKQTFSDIVGFFVNPIALRSYPDATKPFKQYLAEVKTTVLAGLEHQHYPFSLLVENLQPERESELSPIYRAWFVLQADTTEQPEAAALALGIPNIPVHWPGLSIKTAKLSDSIAQFDIALMVAESSQGLIASLQYRRDLFEFATIRRMAQHFQNLVTSVLTTPDALLSQLTMLSNDELKLQLCDWNTTTKDYPSNELIHGLFVQQALKTPEAIALCFDNQQMTYGELHQQSEYLSHYLISFGVKADQIVGICLERSFDLVVGLMAILKAGGAYLPLDPSLPNERLSFMLQRANTQLVLTKTGLLDETIFSTAKPIYLDASIPAFLPVTNSSEFNLHNIAYCIYTSGSTGKPKGVIVPHAGILNRLQWMQEAYKLTIDDKVLQKTPYGFDVSVWEFFWPLMIGATLVIAKPGEHKNSKSLIRTIIQQGITTIHFVPSMLQVFLDTPDVERCTSLKRVICSGEALSSELVERFYQKLSAELHNLYGPTEASVDVTAWYCDPKRKEKRIPIGRPIANTSIYLLDKTMNPVPLGQAAELYIGGIGLARGYINQPELTQTAFVENPFDNNSRLYKTGDLARFREDGAIEYLGRIDTQVKLRGVRIELGEIETALLQITGTKEAVVDLHTDSLGNKQLVAYLVGNGEIIANTTALKSHLRSLLPDYMIPILFIELASLPLSHNGKLDRKALPASHTSPIRQQAFVAPRDEAEQAVAAIWSQVLGMENISIYDNFFDIGGHSLSGAQIMALVDRSFDISAPIQLLFEAPTIAEFVDRLADYQNALVD
jgi:amino acid adenylation domain-containing protein